jgi:hypothetical protein
MPDPSLGSVGSSADIDPSIGATIDVDASRRSHNGLLTPWLRVATGDVADVRESAVRSARARHRAQRRSRQRRSRMNPLRHPSSVD